MTITHKTITKATALLSREITAHLKSTEAELCQKIRKFCLGVCGDNSVSLDKHRSHLLREEHRRNGLIMLALVDEKSIPADCIASGYIIHAQRYAHTLKERVEGKFKTDRRLARRTTHLECEDDANYIIYLAFGLEGNGYVLETGIPLVNKSMRDATERVSAKIKEYVREIE